MESKVKVMVISFLTNPVSKVPQLLEHLLLIVFVSEHNVWGCWQNFIKFGSHFRSEQFRSIFKEILHLIAQLMGHGQIFIDRFYHLQVWDSLSNFFILFFCIVIMLFFNIFVWMVFPQKLSIVITKDKIWLIDFRKKSDNCSLNRLSDL